MANINTAKEKRMEDLNKDMGGIQRDIESSAESITQGEGRGSNVTARVQEVASKVGDRARDFGHVAQDYGQQAFDRSVSLIRRYPSQAVLAGFGIGLFFGMLFTRR